MPNLELADRLASLPELQGIPGEELEWLAAHGRLEVHEPGVLMAPGEAVEHLLIVLSGHVVVRVDRGVGPRRVMEWTVGQVTGVLPFSRFEKVENDVLAEVSTELLAVHQRHFPEMVERCPGFTAFTVHSMVDRARRFRTSDLQDEKTMSLGRLAAGLAHELNNPASATMRGAKVLRAELPDAERASRALCRVGLPEDRITELEQICSDWWEPSPSSLTLQREDEISDWLKSRGADVGYAEPLAETSVTIERLDELAGRVPAETLNAVLEWIVAGSAVRSVALDVEKAATRIYDLVASVKRFTHMDKVSGPEAVDVEAGLRDTMRIVSPRVTMKGASLTLEAEPNVPPVQALGSDLNQAWMNLIENAIDAVGDAGQIEITVRRELDRVVVRVIDDGPGIESDVLPHIFDPFFTTKAPGQGIGLGLETARQLLRRNGGEIAAGSESGRTEFRVSLPVDDPSGHESS